MCVLFDSCYLYCAVFVLYAPRIILNCPRNSPFGNMCACLLTRSTLRPLCLLCATPAESVSPQVQHSKHQQAIAADAADTADTAGTAAGTYRRRKQCTLRGKKGMSRGTIWAWLGTNIISSCSSCCNRPTTSNNLMTTWPQDATSPSASKHLDATARPVRSNRARCNRGRRNRGRANPLTPKKLRTNETKPRSKSIRTLRQ